MLLISMLNGMEIIFIDTYMYVYYTGCNRNTGTKLNMYIKTKNMTFFKNDQKHLTA